MKKVFKLRDLDCANCGQKMEDAIRKIEGVEDANVSFMMQKLTVVADEAKMDEIMKKAVKACKKIEPDCEIVLK
jgi:cation transport ATPase